MKNAFLLLLFIPYVSYSQTSFRKTAEQFKNKEFVWDVVYNQKRVGEFWPIKGLSLVTKQTDPAVFTGDIATIQQRLGAVAMAPDGMTAGSVGSYRMQGKSLSHGRPCGDGFVYDYGIVIVSSNGYGIQFTHKRETNFDSLYSAVKAWNGSLFFLPSIYRNGNYLSSDKKVDKVLIRRKTFDGDQVGVVFFDNPLTYDEIRAVILGLDRTGASETTHVYVLDGGPVWGQSSKNVNEKTKVIGTRDNLSVTNYLVFY